MMFSMIKFMKSDMKSDKQTWLMAWTKAMLRVVSVYQLLVCTNMQRGSSPSQFASRNRVYGYPGWEHFVPHSISLFLDNWQLVYSRCSKSRFQSITHSAFGGQICVTRCPDCYVQWRFIVFSKGWIQIIDLLELQAVLKRHLVNVGRTKRQASKQATLDKTQK